jgi:transposase InsO family protein
VDLGQFLIETHLRTGQPIGELAAAHDISRGWLYKLLVRYRREGPAGLEPRSRRPRRSPTRISDRWEEDIVALRKELLEAGFDAGAETIRFHLSRRGGDVPSTSTIWRVLKARGFVTPQPRKRPNSSWHRFCAELPNECWQADVTHWVLADGTEAEVLNIIDDHSRVCVEATKKQLQTQLNHFVVSYNATRPHRALGRRTPLEVHRAREKAYPRGPKVDCTGYRIRRDKVSSSGNVTLRYRGRLHHIGVGAAYKGWRVTMLVAGREVRILGPDGAPLRRLKLDPTKDYQPMP